MMRTFAQPAKPVQPASAALPPSAPRSSTAGVNRALHGFDRIALRLPIQAKLVVGSTRDDQERQADEVAEQVVGGSPPGLQLATVGGSAPPRVEDAGLESRLNATRGRGSPLPAWVRSFMEPRFGADFGAVRVHTGSEAAGLSGALGARAFTHGTDIYYGAGKSAANDRLTAHELVHVVQQARGDRSGIVRRAPEERAIEQEETPVERERRILDEGEAAVAEGRLGLIRAPAELYGPGYFVLFDDFRVQRLFRYLMHKWLNASGYDPALEEAVSPEAPRWVGEFRARALNPRPQKPGSPEHATYMEQKRLGDLAVSLADAVAAETPSQMVRRRMVEEIDRSVGSTIMSPEAIKKKREVAATPGFTPANFTTCIVFFSETVAKVAHSAGIKGPLLLGPNAYVEINPAATETLPPGAWHPCTKDSRPKPGDLLIFRFAEREKAPSGGYYGKGWFAHISILRSIEPLDDPSAEPMNAQTSAAGAAEKWISVDGGGTTANVVTRYFFPDSCIIKDPRSKPRTLHGWIDVEAAAAAKILQPPTTAPGQEEKP